MMAQEGRESRGLEIGSEVQVKWVFNMPCESIFGIRKFGFWKNACVLHGQWDFI
jgi:hypothetical protein